jgi:CheY-like chemotaxis protein
MLSTFFLTDLPPTIAEPTLRKVLRKDISVSVSFRDSPAGTVAMVEARNAQEARRAAHELAQTGGRGTPLTLVAPDTPEGQQLRLIFAAREEQEQRECGKRSAYSACILIVDDNSESLLGIQEVLALDLPQACLHIANSGLAAITINRTREFDAILSDVQVAGVDGFSLVRHMQLLRPHTPVILMTTTPYLMPSIVKSGAFGFLRKPVNGNYCVSALQHAMMYYSLSKLAAKAKKDSGMAVDVSMGLRWLANAELGESLTRWNHHQPPT